MKGKVMMLIALADIAVAAAACNTIEGVGKDVEATGNAIEKAADKSKPR